jgi:HEAT repeat protein
MMYLKKHRTQLKLLIFLIFATVVSSCSESENENAVNSKEVSKEISQANIEVTAKSTNESVVNKSASPSQQTENEEFDYQALRYKITYKKANFSEIRKSLTEKNAGGLSNTMHALYSMRWNRRGRTLLYDLWNMKTDLYPELTWKEISKPPVRIALASTIHRMQSEKFLDHPDTYIYKKYIRTYKYDDHEFIRAQVVIALGLAGDPADVPYLKEMAEGDNKYVRQSSITALGLMNNKQASDALVELFKKNENNPIGKLILGVLKEAYDLHPRYRVSDEAGKES